eukprot:scaffold81803_cov69-Phaeocystis_antarctica.AAC.1
MVATCRSRGGGGGCSAGGWASTVMKRSSSTPLDSVGSLSACASLCTAPRSVLESEGGKTSAATVAASAGAPAGASAGAPSGAPSGAGASRAFLNQCKRAPLCSRDHATRSVQVHA